MPTARQGFPVHKPTARVIPLVGRQSAILAKTLFTNRFPSLAEAGQTQGIRVGGRGFQMIKEALRESPGFEVSRALPAACSMAAFVRCTICRPRSPVEQGATL